MPSNDARILLSAAIPAAATGAIAAVVGGVVAGGKGALGAVIGCALVIAFMGIGLVVLQRTAKSYPHLFQAMGLLLYTTQLLFLFLLIVLFKKTTFFDFKTFAFTVLAVTLVWIAAQARAYMKAKIMYIDDQKKSGSST